MSTMSEEDTKRLAEIQRLAKNGYPHPYRVEIDFLLRLFDTAADRTTPDASDLEQAKAIRVRIPNPRVYPLSTSRSRRVYI